MALVVISGGARSGKSAAAERLAEQRLADGSRVTVAVFGRADDDEMAARIGRHREERHPGFETLEAVDAVTWTERVPEGSLLVVDCLGTLLGLAMETAWEQVAGESFGEADRDSLPSGYADACRDAFAPAVEWIAGRRSDTIVVTNEVGLGIVPDWASARLFRDELGRANRLLADAADAAYLAIAGRLLALGPLPRDARWPED